MDTVAPFVRDLKNGTLVRAKPSYHQNTLDLSKTKSVGLPGLVNFDDNRLHVNGVGVGVDD